MSFMFDSARIHAASFSKLTDFVNRESITLYGHNPKLKLSHSQALEYVARISGYNTYKGMEVGGFTQLINTENLSAKFSEVFNKQFKSIKDDVALTRLKQIHSFYLSSQLWCLDEISDLDTALAISYANVSKWNDISAIYLKKNLYAAPKWSDNRNKTQLELSHLFTANLLGHLCTKYNDQYDLNEDLDDVNDLLGSVSSNIIGDVAHAYNSMAWSCIHISDLGSFAIKRTVTYLMAVANNEDSVDDSAKRVNPFELFNHARQSEYAVLMNMSIKDLGDWICQQEFNFDAPYNVPYSCMGGEAHRFFITQLPVLNSTIIGQDYQALKYCPENMSLNQWDDLLGNFYNAALDFSQIVFENYIVGQSFSFHKIYFDKGGRVCYKTTDKIEVRVNGNSYKLSANDFNMWFSLAVSSHIVAKGSMPFSQYMNWYYQYMLKNAVDSCVGLDKPQQVLALFSQ